MGQIHNLVLFLNNYLTSLFNNYSICVLCFTLFSLTRLECWEDYFQSLLFNMFNSKKQTKTTETLKIVIQNDVISWEMPIIWCSVVWTVLLIRMLSLTLHCKLFMPKRLEECPEIKHFLNVFCFLNVSVRNTLVLFTCQYLRAPWHL